MTTENILQDQGARDAIVEALDRNLMVLAGAGAGKTHALIERMVRSVGDGQAEVDRIAAITFTRKAAGEMRGRFFLRLREEAGRVTGAEAERIGRALEKVDQCFIGTIHAFCGQLLRERPVEAGLAPDFTEIEDRDEAVLRREAWDRFVQRCFVDSDSRLEHLEGLGLRTEDLYAFFERRCLFSDVVLKQTTDKVPDLKPAVEEAVAFIQQVKTEIPDPLPDRRDAFMEALTRAEHLLAHRGLDTDGDRVALLNLLLSKSGKGAVTLKCWRPNQDFAKTLRDERLPHFQEEVIGPALIRWRHYVYAHVAGFVDEAMRYYEGQRRAAGRLTFQDLLSNTAALLRDHSSVRTYFQTRYRHLFVDEFQDTDPIQAEMLLYLTGTDTEETDWRRLEPRPGSLFLVGDEKQSIYRFRRADVETFRLVRDRIAATGGHVVELNTSFRSLGRFCDWINTAFSPLFSAQGVHYQAEFSPLFKHRPDGLDPHGVCRLTVEKISRNPRDGIVAQEAERIADFIAAAVAGQTGFKGTEEDAILDAQASPGDFMVLTRTTRYMDRYARALEARGIPYDIAGGGRLGDAVEFQALVEMLEAVHTPDNPLPLLGYTRGPLVGLGDDELYAFHRCGGRFDYRAPLPDGLPETLEARLKGAFERLDRAVRWMGANTPATGFERVLEDLGLVAFAAAKPMGSSRAGNLLRVLALVRTWENQGMHWGQILAELRALIEDADYKVEEMTLESGREDVVRLMNLHQAKGLQARVVFLADSYDTSADRHGADFHVSRTGVTPFLSMPVSRPRGAYATEVIAEPRGWEEDAEEEARFLQAEDLRLLYVAATRAENLLVVCRYAGNRERGPWAALYPFLDDVPELPEVAAPAPPEPEALSLDWEQQRTDREKRWRAIKRWTYAVHSLTGEDSDTELSGLSEGREYEAFIHRLFGAAVRGRLSGKRETDIRRLIAEADLDPDIARDARAALDTFRASDLWREIGKSETVYTEVPFAASNKEKGRSNILRGVIPLVYRISGGWKIVDYRTDPASTDAEAQALLDRAAPQVKAYAEHWQAITGEPVAEVGIWIAESSLWQNV